VASGEPGDPLLALLGVGRQRLADLARVVQSAELFGAVIVGPVCPEVAQPSGRVDQQVAPQPTRPDAELDGQAWLRVSPTVAVGGP
jgi:hypothetical protein